MNGKYQKLTTTQFDVVLHIDSITTASDDKKLNPLLMSAKKLRTISRASNAAPDINFTVEQAIAMNIYLQSNIIQFFILTMPVTKVFMFQYVGALFIAAATTLYTKLND